LVLCLIALPVFAVMGIFSFKYRKLALESLNCLLRTATFRKCRSSLDEQIKGSITGKLIRLSPKASVFVYRNYKILSFLALLLFAFASYGSAVGIYNYVQYGNCNGPEDVGFCVLDPTGQNSKLSELDIDIPTKVILPELEANDPIIGPKSAELTVIEFGCYACPYTKKAEPIVEEVIAYYKGKVNFQFKTMLIPHHAASLEAALAAECSIEQGKYEQYHSLLFQSQTGLTEDSLVQLAGSIGMDTGEFKACLETQKFKDEVSADTLQGYQAAVAGTPTFFVNGQRITGPKPFRTFKTIIDRELKK